MDKYEYRVKLDQIEKLVRKKDYVTAAKIADGIDWRKVKSVTTLSMIADIYDETDRLEDCYEILNMVYDRSPVSRRIVYRLAEVAVKMHDFKEAIELYKEFVRIAPHDLSKYILKYQIYRERGSSVTDQITILEEYKSHEYSERWSYELACLYEEAGMTERCIEECDELILWFSEGEYVAKALELKMKYQELTAVQQEKYEHRFDAPAEEEEGFFDEEDEAVTGEEQEIPAEPENEETTEAAETVVQTEEPENEEEDAEDTVSVPIVNTGKFSTINLQAELAKGLRLVMAQMMEENTDDAEQETAEAAEEAEPTKEVLPKEPSEHEAAEDAVQEPAEEAAEETTEEAVQEPIEEAADEPQSAQEKLSETAELKTELLKYSSVEQEPKMDELLRVEEDGQIGLDIEDSNILQKQITGQMTIEEILEAWEEKKRQAKEQMEKAGEHKTPVLYETGEITSLLEDFIPRTPKDVIPEPETEDEAAEDAETEAPAAEEPQNIEDDLPLDIDLEEALSGFLGEPESGKEVSDDTASMLDAIEKALAMETMPSEPSGRYLTEEEEKIFAYFTSVSGMKKQLTDILAEDSKYTGRADSKEGNLIITGHPGNGKTTLAIDIVKAFQKQRRVKGGKLAKVTGDGMNKKEPGAVISKLGGGAMIIERAGALSAAAVQKLSDAMEQETGGLLVILEDSAEEIAELLKKNAAFAAKFNRSVDIPIFSNDELVAFGKSYAEEQEYYFDEMAVLALYDCIGIRQTSDHVVNITEVKEFVDDAMDHADRKSRGLFARISKKRIDEYGNRLLLEEDFDF